MPPKRKCVFNNDLETEFPFIKKASSEHEVKCRICFANFSIANSGLSNIKQHIETRKHQTAVLASSSSNQITKFYRNQNFNCKEKQLAVIEGSWAYHSVQHNYSFRSNDCTSKLIKSCFEEKYSCARTKCEAIIKNIFAPISLDLIKADLFSTSCITIYLDCSNHGPIKLCPILVRYFLPNKGIMVKILGVKELQGETSDIISKSLQETLIKYDATRKMVAFCADNTNCNFGGAARKGLNNIFKKMQDCIGKNLIGVNCVAHILNNCIQTAAESLPVDIEVIIVKIFSFFYIYTVRVQQFKEICENVDIEYKKLLGHSKTRWLSLKPALERILKLFVPLKEYFLSQQKCPTILRDLFNNPCAEVWLIFAHSQASIFHKYILRLESQDISMAEASLILKELKLILIERKQEVFLPLVVSNALKLAGTVDEYMIKKEVTSFYGTCIDYLSQWDTAFKDIEHFEWVLLRSVPCWQSIEKSLVYLKNLRDDIEINNEDLFDEVVCVKNYVDVHKIEKWRNDGTSTGSKWKEIFSHFFDKYIPCKNILKFVEFSLCLPASNAPTERVFSLCNNIWTSEKSQLKVATLESILITKSNFQMDCTEFKIFLEKNENDLLKKIHSVEKYL